MKPTFLIIATSTLFFSCKSKESSLNKEQSVVTTDTVGLYKSNILTDTGKSALVNAAKPVSKTPPLASPKQRNNNGGSYGNSSNSNNGSSNSNNSSGSNGTNNTVYSDPVPRDKKISKAAQGAAIGAGSGAIIGAVVSKNKGQGAIIGGVLGGTAGYAIGRDGDKRSGRVARKRASRRAAANN